MTIRPAGRDDLPAILEIYNEAVISTTATYDYETQSIEQRIDWFENHREGRYPILVAEKESTGVVAWCSLSRFHSKPGYRFTTENTLYVRSDHRGQGIGKRMMSALIEEARKGDWRVLVALIDSENGPSIRLHESFGFEKAGHLKQVGFKFDRWLDVVYMQLILD